MWPPETIHQGDRIMHKRFFPLSLIAAGVLLAVAGLVYWRFVSAVENEDDATLP